MSELYPSSEEEPAVVAAAATLPLVLTSRTFNCIDHLKLLGFSKMKAIYVHTESAPLLRFYVHDAHIQTFDVDAFHMPASLKAAIRECHIFHDGATNSKDLLQLGDVLSAEGVRVYISHCAPGDVRAGSRPY